MLVSMGMRNYKEYEMSDADNMRKYMGIINESHEAGKDIINEAKPMSFWKQLMTKANVFDVARNKRI